MTLKLLKKEVFVKAPEADGEGILSVAFNVAGDPKKLARTCDVKRRSDVSESTLIQFSDDGGLSWGSDRPWWTLQETDNGMLNRHARGMFYDPKADKTIFFWCQGVFAPGVAEGVMHNNTIHYAVSEDACRSFSKEGQLINEGCEYDSGHPLPGIEVGKAHYMMGDLGSYPLLLGDGTILLPFQLSQVDSDGMHTNPGGGYTYHDSAIMIGQWQDDGDIAWTMSGRIEADPATSTRGMLEPTLAELEDGTILAVMRGSNGPEGIIPSYRWCAFSKDKGRSWSKPEPWSYSGGEKFFSPSSCSQLLSNGKRLFWIGNITPENPRGNEPRYPLVAGEVDMQTGLLLKDTIIEIDTKQAQEDPHLTLSNLYARFDRQSGDIKLYMSRFFSKRYFCGKAGDHHKLDWSTDSFCYTIQVS